MTFAWTRTVARPNRSIAAMPIHRSLVATPARPRLSNLVKGGAPN